MVTCEPNDADYLIVSKPQVIVEVLSPSTRAIDLREKLFFYRQIDSLETYLIIEQEERRVYRHWRDDERIWWSETVPEDATISIPGLAIELTYADIYRKIGGLNS